MISKKIVLEYFDENKKLQFEEKFKTLFLNSSQVLSQGYVDDEKNTDNSWIESCMIHLHDQSGDYFNQNLEIKKSGKIFLLQIDASNLLLIWFL